MKFSPGIQYLRAVAAISVAVYHVLLHWLPAQKPGFVFLSGGVDVFFVISGFVMWGVTSGREGGAWSFLSKRLKRIVPLYWLMTTIMLAIMIARPSVMLNSRFDVVHVITSYLFIPWIHPVTRQFEPLLFPGWTLNYEMAFYVVFALALFAPLRLRLPLIVGALLVAVGLGFIPHPANTAIDFYTSTIILEFALGVVLGALVTSGVSAPVWAAAILAIIGAVTAVVFPTVLTTMPRIVRWGLPAAALVYGCVFLERATGPRLARLPLLLGDASYSIYLVHVLIVSALFQVARKIHVLQSPAGMILAMTATVAASVAAGIAVYWLIERPMIQRFKVPTPESKPLVGPQAAG